MSDARATPTVPDPQALRQEGEHLPTRSIAWVGIGTVEFFTVTVIVTAFFMRATIHDAAPQGSAPIGREIGTAEFGIVDQEVFAKEHRAATKRQEQLEHLASYGWVSRKHEVIHIPVERAMELVIAGKPQAPFSPEESEAAAQQRGGPTGDAAGGATPHQDPKEGGR